MAPYSKNHPVKFPSKRKYILIALAVILVVCALLGALEKTGTINLINDPAPKSPTTTDGINYDPPTKEDAKAVEDQKENIVKQQEGQKPTTPSPSPGTATKKSVKPVIVSATATTVRSYVPGIVESGGTCTATLTKAGQTTVTRTAAASPDAQNTNCIVDYSGTPAGSGWQVTVTYSSAVSEGTSDAFGI